MPWDQKTANWTAQAEEQYGAVPDVWNAGQYRKWVSGRYYGGNAGPLVTAGPGVGMLSFVPLWVPNTVTIDRIGIEVTTGVASGVGRLGIYTATSATDDPLNLVAEYGTIDGSTTGVKELTISQSLLSGLYWTAIAIQGASFTVRAMQGSIPPVASNTYVASGAGNNSNCYYMTAVNGALPSSINPAALSANALAPRIQVRVA